MLRSLRLFLLLLLASTATKSFADFTPLRYCSGMPACYQLSGEITDRDVLAVRAMVQDLQTRSLWAPHVELNSRGGNVDAAIEIGRNLRKVRAIATMGESEVCLSACVFVLAGATQRAIGGSVGIHRPYSERTGVVSIEEAQREYTRLSRAAKTFLSEMNLPEALYEAMVRTPPEQMRLLNQSELAAFGLNTTDPVEQEIFDSQYAKQYGLTKQEYLRRKARATSICDSLLQKITDSTSFNAWNSCIEKVMRTAR